MIFFKKIQMKSQLGFSLVEIMVAISVLSVGVLATMKTVDYVNKQAVKTESQADFEQLIFAMDNYLGRKDVCETQLIGQTLGQQTFQTLTDPTPLAGETAEGTGVVFSTGVPYLENKVTILEMKLVKMDDSAVPAMKITFNRKERANATTSTTTVRTIPLIHELDAAQQKIEKCYETDSSLFDIKYALAKRMCQGGSTTSYLNGRFDEITGICYFYGMENDKVCNPGEAIKSITFDPANDKYVANCQQVVPFTTCPNTWVKSIDTSGNVQCLGNIDQIVDSQPFTMHTTPSQNCGLTVVGGAKIKLQCSPGMANVTLDPLNPVDLDEVIPPPPPSCVPALSCLAIKAQVCANQNAGNNSCGTPCGQGTKTAGCVKCTAQRCHLNNLYGVTCYLNGTYTSSIVPNSSGSCDNIDHGGGMGAVCSQPSCN